MPDGTTNPASKPVALDHGVTAVGNEPSPSAMPYASKAVLVYYRGLAPDGWCSSCAQGCG